MNLLIASAQDVAVRGNRFENAQQRPLDRGQRSGIDPTALIWLNDCRDIRFQDNAVFGLGTCCQRVVKLCDSATNVSGVTQGIRVAGP